jgi:hypothetical protein
MNVRCDVLWQREPAQFHAEPAHGLWFPKKGSGMASASGPPVEALTLSSNGSEEHLALVVKYPGDKVAYVVQPNSVHEYGRYKWRLPGCAIDAGTYMVSVRFRADGGGQAEIVLRVRIARDSSEMSADILTGRSRYPDDQTMKISA